MTSDHLDRDGIPLPGGPLEEPDTRFRIRRRVRGENPADLGAPLS